MTVSSTSSTSGTGSAIATALGVGSGIDSSALVSQLVAAVRGPRESAITSQQSTNSTQISALASASSSLDTFAKALQTTLDSAGFAGQPVSNDPTIVAASAIAGGVPQGLPAQIEVVQLAAAQTSMSGALANSTATVGTGTLTLTPASGTAISVTLDSSNNTLDGLAAAINGKNAGITATVVTDNQGARLVLKGATGAGGGFTLTAGSDADGALSGFVGGVTNVQAAADSIVKIDNVEMHNSSNTLTSAIPYVRIDLNKAAPGTSVTIASNQPTSNMRDLVSQFVDAYNTLRKALNDATAPGTNGSGAGALAGDPGVRDMMQRLSTFTSTNLASGGPYRTLVDIGVSTNRDGTLSLDTNRLDAALAADPTAVTQMLNPAVSSAANPGLAQMVQNVRDALQGTNGSLVVSQNRLDSMKQSLADQLDKLNSDMDSYQSNLTDQFAAMDKQLTALKATQTYLQQQIQVWNGSNNNK